MIWKDAKDEKGSGERNHRKVGRLSAAQFEEIAKLRMHDLNGASLESDIKSIRGTARSMGIEIK